MFKYDADSKFSAFVGRLADIFLLNVLWLVFSLPLVTVGASTLAAFSVCMRLVEGEETPIARGFLKGFRENLRQGVPLGVLGAVALYALYIDWQIVFKSDEPPIILVVASLVSTVLVACAFVYAFPIASRYRNSLGRDLANSLRLCSRYPGRTALLFALLLFEVAVFAWNETMMLFGIAIGPMILVYTVGSAARRIFSDVERESGADFSSGGKESIDG